MSRPYDLGRDAVRWTWAGVVWGVLWRLLFGAALVAAWAAVAAFITGAP